MTDTVVNNDRILTEDDFSQLKRARNNMLSSTDKYMLISDLPEPLLVKITEFRDAIRNIDTKFGTEWVMESDISWPAFPQEFMSKTTVPFVPPPGSDTEV